jgi:hypothetical protein
MKIEMHPSVQKVAEFMQRELRADELFAVAEAMPAVAAVLWAQYERAAVVPLNLRHQWGEPLPRVSSSQQQVATE